MISHGGASLSWGGYLSSNPAMGDDITVPEYRTVAGQYLDASRRPYRFAPELSFVEQTRLNGEAAAQATSRERSQLSFRRGSFGQDVTPHRCERREKGYGH